MKLPNRPNRKITPEQVQRLLSDGCSAAECSRRLGVNSKTVDKVIKRYKLKRASSKWSRIPLAHRKIMIKMIKNGLPILYVAKQFGRSFRHICSIVKEAGVMVIRGRASRERFPVAEREVEDHLTSMVKWVRGRYPAVPVELIQTAVHVGAAELRQYPRRDNWLGFWRQISERRLVDMIREDCGRNGKKGEVLLSRRSALVENDLAELPLEDNGLKEAIAKLPNELRRIISAVIRCGGPEAARTEIEMSESTFYARLSEAYTKLRITLEK